MISGTLWRSSPAASPDGGVKIHVGVTAGFTDGGVPGGKLGTYGLLSSLRNRDQVKLSSEQ